MIYLLGETHIVPAEQHEGQEQDICLLQQEGANTVGYAESYYICYIVSSITGQREQVVLRSCAN